ncbi:hypothetical protein LF845_10870 [Deferribacterales bacterium Es71-Z0220]|jgi:hypothetical protein|uniref:hypothetical protein n=1 Tax=Deferrivibrio essentukiensis TaxID=2880922 RepID=UPI001F623165|nr:hypothetical protein [Deferrivibrio essentukiensis]MCB4205456.1 hypothetical protein [Deferrivibrio essentukiensis]
MKKFKSRREFLKLGMLAASTTAIAVTSKKSYAKAPENVDNEILYRETEHFKKYYETLK